MNTRNLSIFSPLILEASNTVEMYLENDIMQTVSPWLIELLNSNIYEVSCQFWPFM